MAVGEPTTQVVVKPLGKALTFTLWAVHLISISISRTFGTPIWSGAGTPIGRMHFST